jgi:hypothetical protein
VQKLSAILRLADGLDQGHESRVKDITCVFPRSKTLALTVRGAGDIRVDIEGARQKRKLMNEVFNVEVAFEED